MTWKAVSMLALLPLACANRAAVVNVKPPTGDMETDRARVLAALEEVRPGGTVQFPPGTYLIGEMIRVAVPRVTLQGHEDGTTLRGCEAADFPDVLEVGFEVATVPCNGLLLAAGHQTVRNLIFENAWHALVVGPPAWGQRAFADPDFLDRVMAATGGHLIYGNTFRNSPNGIRVMGQWSEPTIIRGNRFENTFHAVVVNGRTAHLLHNEISVPDPEHTNEGGHPSVAIAIFCGPELPSCDENVVAGNRIHGHPDGISIGVAAAATARNNVIRDNTIVVRRVGFARAWDAIRMRSESDSTIVGIPLMLFGLVDDGGEAGTVENNRIEGNSILGASGVAMQVFRASRNRIANNTIADIRLRDPFPGNTLGDDPLAWRVANGSGIWVSPGSDENEIVSNRFEDTAAHAIVLEGDRNIVQIRSANEAVRDLGSANLVTSFDGR